MKRYGNQLWVQVVGPDRYRIGMTDQLQCDAGDISYANIAPLGALDVDDTLVNLEASKAAIIAYADALRLELYETPIQVSTINPGPVKTAFFDRSPQMLAYAQVVEAFSLEADELASRIVANMKRKHVKRELNLPWQLAFASKLYGLFPQAGDFLAARLFNLKEE